MVQRVTADVVQGLVNTVLSSKFDEATESPPFHRELWELFCSKHNLIAASAPRGHAKTTGGTLSYGLATLLFRERRFMLLVSDTEAQAMMFLGLFREHLQDNDSLIEIFGLKRDEKGKVKFSPDTQSDIGVEFEDGHKFRIIAKGAEQKLRGLIWDGRRPDIILCDDMENDELVMSKERREKMRQWFFSALVPCRSANGIIRVVGTILHMDSLLERLMPKPYSRWSHQEDLKLWSEELQAGGWRSVKYRAHNDDFSKLLWPTRFSKEKFKQERESFIAQGLPDKYSQEYLNIPIDPSIAYFKRDDLRDLSIEDKKKPVNYYITVDLAISEASRADYSVFLIAGVDADRRIQIRDVIREKLDGREIVDTLINLNRVYKPEFVGIEEMQVSKAIGPFLREEMVRTGEYLNLLLLKHGGKDKIARAKSMQARVRAGNVFFDKSRDWYQTFEDELTRFPRDTHDDQVDAFAYLGLLLDKINEAPTEKELLDDEYLDELREYERDHGNPGRSRVTGY